MRRVLVPGLLAIALVASSSANASAFGLFDRLSNRGCDSGCEVACAPVCEPVCGYEVVDPCCPPKRGLLHNLFHRNRGGCDSGCAAVEPVCGFEPVCEPVCEPACGYEVAPSCGCEASCGKKRPLGGLLHKLFHRNRGCCDSGCEMIEPACGCEPACGFEVAPSCGCGH